MDLFFDGPRQKFYDHVCDHEGVERSGVGGSLPATLAVLTVTAVGMISLKKLSASSYISTTAVIIHQYQMLIIS